MWYSMDVFMYQNGCISSSYALNKVVNQWVVIIWFLISFKSACAAMAYRLVNMTLGNISPRIYLAFVQYQTLFSISMIGT